MDNLSELQNLSGRQDEIHFEVTSGACAWCAAQQGMFVLVRSLKNEIRLHYLASWKEYPSSGSLAKAVSHSNVAGGEGLGRS